MIAHVAEAAESSGRVVLWLDPETPCDAALFDAPVRLAAAYGAEVETIVIAPKLFSEEADENAPLRRVVATGLDNPEPDAFETRVRFYRRTVELAGAENRVVVRHAITRGDAVDRIAEMCMLSGPWNIVALPRLPVSGGYSLFNAMLANVSGATGFLLSGTAARGSQRIVVIVEDEDRLPSMLRAGDRMAGLDGALMVMIGAETAAAYSQIEAQTRLVAAETRRVTFQISRPTCGVSGAMLDDILRLKPTGIVARFGGAAIADGAELSRASAALRAPILLVR